MSVFSGSNDVNINHEDGPSSTEVQSTTTKSAHTTSKGIRPTILSYTLSVYIIVILKVAFRNLKLLLKQN